VNDMVEAKLNDPKFEAVLRGAGLDPKAGIDITAWYASGLSNSQVNHLLDQRTTYRPPKFCEWMRGVWAGEQNPTRDGMFVRALVLQRSKCYQLTDGEGKFWEYPRESTVFLEAINAEEGK